MNSKTAFLKKGGLILVFIQLCLPMMLLAQQSQVSGVSKSTPVHITRAVVPPYLLVKENSLVLFDNNNNNRIDALEHGSVDFVLQNKGKGTAFGLTVSITEKSSINGLVFENNINVGRLEPGQEKKISIPVRGEFYLTTGTAELSIVVKEKSGFDSDPMSIKFKTLEFLQPNVKIVDAQFNTEGGGTLRLGLPVTLKVIVQNIGQGVTDNISSEFQLPDMVFATDATKFAIGKLLPGESKVLNFEFTANKQYNKPRIPITVHLTERYGKYAHDTILQAAVNQVLAKVSKDIDTRMPEHVNITNASLTSDVDKNIPQNNKQNESRFALIIGNEDYSNKQKDLSSESDVEFARNDARVFKQYCMDVLGIPKDQIIYHEDATRIEMEKDIEKIEHIEQTMEGQAEVFVFYAGHGFPDEKTKDAYIIPVDISGADAKSGISLQSFYRGLSEHPCKRITIFLDACFSGGARNQPLLAGRFVKISPNSDPISGNMVIFAASNGEQSALPYAEKQHGLFTYFLLKKLQDSGGNVSYDELYKYLRKEVSNISNIVNSKIQDATVIPSPDVADQWRSWKFN